MSGKSKKRGWVSKYPDYPDLTDGRLGDVQAVNLRDEHGPGWSDDGPTEEQTVEYEQDTHYRWASLMQSFADAVDAGEPVSPWVASNIASAFRKVLKGDAWEDAMPLPGREWKEEWYAISPAEREARLLCDLIKFVIAEEGLGVVAAIQSVAEYKHVSFEKARAAYYAHKDTTHGFSKSGA